MGIITYKELKGLLNFLKYGHADSTVTINSEYLAELIKLAMDNLPEAEWKKRFMWIIWARNNIMEEA